MMDVPIYHKCSCQDISPLRRVLLLFSIVFPLTCPEISLAQECRGDVRFVFYNVENLFDTFDDSLSLDDEFLPWGNRSWTWGKFLEKEHRICKTLASIGLWEPPELVGLCEIENRFVLNWLTRKTPLMKYNYRIIHQDSPDERGIDVALLYLPSRFRVLNWYCVPVQGLRDPTRDVLYVRGLVMDRDTIHILICQAECNLPCRNFCCDDIGGQNTFVFRGKQEAVA